MKTVVTGHTLFMNSVIASVVSNDVIDCLSDPNLTPEARVLLQQAHRQASSLAASLMKVASLVRS